MKCNQSSNITLTITNITTGVINAIHHVPPVILIIVSGAFLLSTEFIWAFTESENADDQFYLKLELSTDSAVVGDNLEAICHVNKTSSSSSSPLSSSSSSSLWYSSSTYLSSSSSISSVPQRQTQQKNYQVIWFKIFPESNADEIEIATNAYINDEFNHTGRYKAGYRLLDKNNLDQVDFYLKISNVQVEDSGYIGCKIGLPGVNSESFLPFNVVVPVYNMWWSSPSSSGADFNSMVFRPNEDLSFVEQEQVFFVCHVNGSYPQPRVRVHIGSEDISHYFASTARLIRVSGVRGLQPVYYSVELTNRSLSIEYRYNDKELKCSASMTPVAGGTWDVESTSIVVKITEYRPKIFCNKKLGIKIGENFTFSCIVKSSPKLHNLTFFKQASAHQHRKQQHHHKQQHLQQQIQPPKHQQSLIAATSTTKSMMPFMPLISRLPKTTTATTTKQMPLKFNNFNNHNNNDDDDNKNNNRNQDINDSNSNSKYSSTNKRNNNSKNPNSNGNNSDANYENSDSNNSTDQFLDDFPPKLVTEDRGQSESLVTVYKDVMTAGKYGRYILQGVNDIGSEVFEIYVFNPETHDSLKSGASRCATIRNTRRQLSLLLSICLSFLSIPNFHILVSFAQTNVH